ncbi:MAG: hypothetical protein NC177_03845 [Ruminococcus flavefaciens]|nr:hypothetical protein [Ruminococcus flavefaciens]
MNPKYAEDLIVAIINEGVFNWYVLHDYICTLDYNILEDAYRKKGCNFIIDESDRFGIRVVDEKTKDEFLENIKPFLVTTSELKIMRSEEKAPDELLGYRPSILIDFDKKCLLSYYPEYWSYEDFVPNGWTGKYQFFEDIIPEKFIFWRD